MFLFKKNVVKTQRKLSEYLPVGTIVKLKNDDKLYMIFRYSGNTCMAYKPKDMLLQKSYLCKSEDAKTVYHVDNGIFTYPTYYLTDLVPSKYVKNYKEKYNNYNDDQITKEEYIVLNDFMIKDENGTHQIDHIVLSKFGIFVIKMKNYYGLIKGKEFDTKWCQYLGRHYKFNSPKLQPYKGFIEFIKT